MTHIHASKISSSIKKTTLRSTHLKWQCAAPAGVGSPLPHLPGKEPLTATELERDPDHLTSVYLGGILNLVSAKRFYVSCTILELLFPVLGQLLAPSLLAPLQPEVAGPQAAVLGL